VLSYQRNRFLGVAIEESNAQDLAGAKPTAFGHRIVRHDTEAGSMSSTAGK
jgi:hypothetical protein